MVLILIAVSVILGALALLDDIGVFSGGYDFQRWVLVGVCGALAPVGCLVSNHSRATLKTSGWLLFVAGALLSTFFFGTTPYPLVESLFYPIYLAAVSGFAILVQRNRSRRGWAVVQGLALCGVLYALLTPSVYLFAVFDGITRPDGYLPWGFANIRFWSHTATWLLPLFPLALIVGSLSQVRLWRVIVVLASGIWWWLVFLSSARGTFCALLIAFVITALVFRGAGWRFYRLLGTQLLAGVGFWAVLSVLVPSLMSIDIDMRSIGTDTSGRIPLWTEAWMMSLERFPFGMGTQAWLTHEPLTEAYREGKTLGSPHNMYLLWAAEYGWLSVLGLGLIGVHYAFRVLHFRRLIAQGEVSDSRILFACGVFMSVVAALTHAGVSGVFIVPPSMLIGLVVLGLFVAVFDDVKEVHKRNLAQSKLRAFAAFAVFLLLLGWGSKVWDYYTFMEKDRIWASENVSVGIKPRFWFHGYYPRQPDLMNPEQVD
ncbi:O-antigen ligase family protein [Halovibrio salipaludis]|uniref:O-antigen ligase family protein n=1 Tax=Halovibrio salipaludis TaxID=2032626 RepID=UPI0013042F4B|nr:O-antigen ligase family protein [Halovibrio salipaludis]